MNVKLLCELRKFGLNKLYEFGINKFPKLTTSLNNVFADVDCWFIDDERFPTQFGELHILRTEDEVRELIDIFLLTSVRYISFDHDLGDEENGTGMTIVRYLIDTDVLSPPEKKVFSHEFNFNVHSQNPVGRENIEKYMTNYLRWRESDESK